MIYIFGNLLRNLSPVRAARGLGMGGTEHHGAETHHRAVV
jgi:hypothetical protein